ncbi:hypothetical protein Tco_0915476 [Tanacetum coccineum]
MITWNKTLSLDELRSPDFNLFSDQEYSEKEVAETMAETMEQYMSKTRADYGSGVSSPKIKDKDNFELKGQFIKELRTNTFNGSDHEDANKHIEKFLEIVYLFHIPNITIDQVMLRAFLCPLTEPQSLVEKERSQLILDSKGAIPSKTVADAKVAIQEMVKYSLKNGIMEHLVDANKAKDPLLTKDCPLKNKGKKTSKKLTTRNLVDLFKEEDIEQQLRDSIKGTTQILRIKNEGNQ